MSRSGARVGKSEYELDQLQRDEETPDFCVFHLSGPDTVRGGYEQVVQGQHIHNTKELVLDPRRTSS
jgi:hypothetical protein